MKIYVSDKEIDNNGLNYVEDDFVEEYWLSRGVLHGCGFEFCDDVGLVNIQSLEQHEEEIRKQERQKVIAELEEFIDKECFTTTVPCDLGCCELGRMPCLTKHQLKEKLNDMKGE